MSIGQVTIQCSCGAVGLALRGNPMMCVACYCDTCQEGSRRIEALPNASSVREQDGGTAYVLYRKDRVRCTKGNEHLKDYQLEQSPKTKRVIASCCNSALMMRFDDTRHWVPIYRARFGPNPPPIQMRICTSFAPENGALRDDVPSHREYPIAFIMKLLSSRVAMLFGS